jgi:Zinc-finger of C2H2 type
LPMDAKKSSRTTSEECLTAAELLRRKSIPVASKSKTSAAETESKENVDNIDEEIRRLEEELQALDEDDDDDDSDASDDDEEETISDKNGIISLSESKKDAIEHLPASCLPAVPRKSKHAHPTSDTSGHKRQRSKEKTNDTIVLSNGLKSAVQEIIRNYQPRSAEKLPFYCRYCSTQLSNEAEFKQHQTLPQHKQAVVLDQKASYCKLCRKQLTSPAQLRDHVQSKPHKERLNFMQSKSRSKQTTK